MIAALAARSAALAARLPWGRIALALGPAVLVVALVVMPLRAERASLREKLTAALEDLTSVRERLQNETDASAAANQRAGAAERASARNARRLEAERSDLADRIQSALGAAIEETENDDSQWARVPLPDRDSWRLCVNVASIAGADRAPCGDSPGNDAESGGAADTDRAGDSPG